MFLFSYLLFNVLLKLYLSFHKFQHNVTVLAQGKRDCWSLLVAKADINLVQLYNGQYNNNVVYRTLCDILLKYIYLSIKLRKTLTPKIRILDNICFLETLQVSAWTNWVEIIKILKGVFLIMCENWNKVLRGIKLSPIQLLRKQNAFFGGLIFRTGMINQVKKSINWQIQFSYIDKHRILES